GKNRIGNILREKLEAVGIDVNYILYGKKGTPQLPPPPPDPILTLILTDCTQKIQQLQNQAIDMNKQLLELNKLLDTIKKRLP
ncbi:MAG: transcriptional regulator, partial [Chlorobiaceae bacterium]